MCDGHTAFGATPAGLVPYPRPSVPSELAPPAVLAPATELTRAIAHAASSARISVAATFTILRAWFSTMARTDPGSVVSQELSPHRFPGVEEQGSEILLEPAAIQSAFPVAVSSSVQCG